MGRLLGCLIAAAASVACVARPARACTWPAPDAPAIVFPINDSVVPPNVKLWVRDGGALGRDVTLRSSRGESLPFTGTVVETRVSGVISVLDPGVLPPGPYELWLDDASTRIGYAFEVSGPAETTAPDSRSW